ncbi:uncharacterized protein LOC141691448 [Apium graveolens]|uniref:uncharacterized protein LOC141691448 n=1 Tax=Apium graveolens TaxID=4045 RepID=UPI003D7994B2
MCNLATRSALPWCMISDFNDLMFEDEKRGGQVHPRNLLTGFTDAVNECDPVDLGFGGEKYAWKKSRGNHNWVKERKVYVPKIQRFRFENVWIKESECKNLVQQSCESVEGEELMTKIELCRMKLEEWGGGATKNFKQKINHCHAKLRKLRSRKDAHGIQSYNEVRLEYLNLLKKQEVYWKQQAKQFWLREGDRNTKFFYSYVSKRKRRNNLQRIKGKVGEWREIIGEIQGVIEGYFTTLFQSSTEIGGLMHNEVVKHITDDESDYLISDITSEEVKVAAFSRHPDKFPGIVGLNPAFFQTIWSIVGNDIFKFCHKFMRTGSISGAINRIVV